MKVALVHPDYKNKVFETLSVPLGLAWISACLKKNDIEVNCFDLAKDPSLEQYIIDNKYDIVFVQLHSQETLKQNLSWIKYFKSKSSSLLVVGGIAVDLNPISIILHEFIDIASLGDGEETSVEICKAIQNKGNLNTIRGIIFKDHNGKLIVTGKREEIRDIDSLPFPDREGFGIDYPQWTIITARGCPFHCKFCSMPKVHNTVRFRSMEKVFEEIEELYKKYGVTKYFIADDTFTINRERVISLCEKIKEKGYDIEWTCVTRADTIDDELLKIMKQAGCIEISCGIESANSDIQLLIGKELNLDLAMKNLLIAKSIGIKVRTSFIFGLPNETRDHIRKSIDFIKIVRPNEVQIYPYVPYTGTEFIEQADLYNIDVASIKFKEKKNLFDPYIGTAGLSKSDIIDMSETCINELRKEGYLWIPGDVPAKKQRLEYVVMTEFAPVQILC